MLIDSLGTKKESFVTQHDIFPRLTLDLDIFLPIVS